ncbi:hypothetical protein, partial [Priestia megaterium]|uniref:hypothetical protein n=1 Tax=Priestia megaterium TaxID=1404 RepID=UPI0030083961
DIINSDEEELEKEMHELDELMNTVTYHRRLRQECWKQFESRNYPNELANINTKLDGLIQIVKSKLN